MSTQHVSVAMQQIYRTHPFVSEDALCEAVFTRILHAANEAIAARGAFHIVLAGGTTPRRVYERLRTASADWSAWHVYWGDERCLPPTDTERNSWMAQQAWLDHVAIPSAQIHVIPAELGAQKAAQAYALVLESVAAFDLVLLGIGEDAHTASLFPGNDWGEAPVSSSSPACLAVLNSPKPPAARVSLSAYRLAQTKALMVLVTGEAKRAALKAWQSGEKVPVGAICPVVGVDMFVTATLLA